IALTPKPFDHGDHRTHQRGDAFVTSPERRTAWSTAENVLCIRLDSLGDVLSTSPAFWALKEGRPGRRVTLLTSHTGAKAARLLPEIDETLVYEAPWMKRPAGDPGT